jgi:hypothetical protein
LINDSPMSLMLLHDRVLERNGARRCEGTAAMIPPAVLSCAT